MKIHLVNFPCGTLLFIVVIASSACGGGTKEAVILESSYGCCREVLWRSFPSMARTIVMEKPVLPPSSDRYKETVVLREFKGKEKCEAVYKRNLSFLEKLRVMYKYVFFWEDDSREIRAKVKLLDDSHVLVQVYDSGSPWPQSRSSTGEDHLKILKDLSAEIEKECGEGAGREVPSNNK